MSVVSIEERAQWKAGVIHVHMWWCGDDHCDCTQPQVSVRLPNERLGFSWCHILILEKGDFHSQATDEELKEQNDQLRKFAIKYGMVLEEQEYYQPYGLRVLTPEEREKYFGMYKAK